MDITAGGILVALVTAILAARVAAGAEVAPQVHAELARSAQVKVLVEFHPGAGVFDGFRARLGTVCGLIKTFAPANTAVVETGRECLKRMEMDGSIRAIEMPGMGFVVAADSLPLVRHEMIAMVGAGLEVEEPGGIGFHVTAEACFGECPRGPESARGPQSGRRTEDALRRQVPPDTSPVADGLNLRLVAVKVGRSGATLSMVAVLEALDWLERTQPQLAAVVLSVETLEVFCGECEGLSVTNRALAAYIARFGRRSVRVLTPQLGHRLRGAPGCLRGAVPFPASVDPPAGLALERAGVAAGELGELRATGNSGESRMEVRPANGQWRRFRVFGEGWRAERGVTVRGLVYVDRENRGEDPVILRPQWGRCGMAEMIE